MIEIDSNQYIQFNNVILVSDRLYVLFLSYLIFGNVEKKYGVFGDTRQFFNYVEYRNKYSREKIIQKNKRIILSERNDCYLCGHYERVGAIRDRRGRKPRFRII